MKLLILPGLLVLSAGFTLAPTRPIDKLRTIPEPPLENVSQEIYALRSLFYFRFTREQLLRLQKIGKETSAPRREHAKAKASDDYRRLMEELRAALVSASDPDRIDDLEDKVFDLQESERPEVDDNFEVTEAARKRVLEVFRMLKPNQLAGYFALMSEELNDPADELVGNLEAIRGVADGDWKKQRDEIAGELAWLVAGLDEKKNAKVASDIVALLTKVHDLNDEEFAAKKTVLEKQAKKLIGKMDPGDVLRHHVIHVLSDLLSNPRLDAAIEAKLAPEK